MTNRFTPDPDKTGINRCDNCSSLFWIKDTISFPDNVYCSEGCSNRITRRKAEWNRIPDSKIIKILVMHEDEWAKRGIMALGKALAPGGPLYQKFSFEATLNIVGIYDRVSKHGWTPNGVTQARERLPKYAGDLWDLALLKQRGRDHAEKQTT